MENQTSNLSWKNNINKLNSIIPPCTYYAMYCTSKQITNHFEKKIRRFLWGSNAAKEKLHLVKWETVILPKKLGGLQIKKPDFQNLSLIANITWRFLVKNPNSIWSQLLRNKYLARNISSGLAMKPRCRHKTSIIWKRLLKGWNILNDGLQWTVGNG